MAALALCLCWLCGVCVGDRCLDLDLDRATLSKGSPLWVLMGSSLSWGSSGSGVVVDVVAVAGVMDSSLEMIRGQRGVCGGDPERTSRRKA